MHRQRFFWVHADELLSAQTDDPLPCGRNCIHTDRFASSRTPADARGGS
jgi:hypothetical protein